MKTEELKQIFTEYLDSNQSNALLINGKWGSGKTFFWKKELEAIIKNKNLKIIYISLNGISKIEYLERILFLKLIPYINQQENKLLKSTINLLTNIINKAGQKYLNTSLTEILNGVSIDSFNFKNYVICFDDLERCQIPSKEILGFINNLVEHKNLKTIILADEDEIKKKDSSYNNIKEKLIFRVINFHLPLEHSLHNLFHKYKTNDDFYNFLNQFKKYIEEIFIEYDERNLRTISFYLEILKKIFPFIIQENEITKKQILLFSSIISIQFKKGYLKSSDYNNFYNYNVSYDHFITQRALQNLIKERTNNIAKEDENKELIDTKNDKDFIYNTFLKNKAKEYSFYSSIYSYILSGFLDKDLLILEINIKNDRNNDSPESLAFRSLISADFRNLNELEFEKELSNLTSFAEIGSYTIYEYLYISRYLYYYCENGLTNLSRQDIYSIIELGIKKSAERKIIDNRALENILHFESETIEEDQVKKMIKIEHEKINHEENFKEFETFLENFQKEESKYIEESKKSDLCANLFKYSSITFLITVIKTMQNKNLRQFTSILKQSFKYYYIHQIEYSQLQENKNSFNTLKSQLQAHVTNPKTEKLNKFLLNELIEEILYIETEIEKKINNSI